MFKKLKIKFITTIMVLLTSIVSIIFGVIYISTKNNNEVTLFAQMNKNFEGVKGGPNITLNKLNNYDGIVVLLDVNDTDVEYKSSYKYIKNNDVVNIVKKILNKRDEGRLAERGFLEYKEKNYAYNIKSTPDGMIMVFSNSDWYFSSLNKLRIIFVAIGICSLAVLFFVSVYIANSSIKPVEAAYNAQKQFIGDASHELKTPLAIIKTNLDIINANETDTIYNQKKWLGYIDFQTDRMSKLVSNLLYLAKADNNEMLGSYSEFNLSDAIMNQVLSFEAIMYENNLRLNCNIKEEIKFKGDKEEINQLIGILIDNAIKHSSQNSEIRINLNIIKQKIVLEVQNCGETIKEEDLSKIFERFYRVDKSRAREKGGYGLGLSIARSIVEKYKGKIRAESNDNITKFITEIPYLI